MTASWPGIGQEFIVSSRPAGDGEQMLDLDARDLAGLDILDCCAGASDWTAKAAHTGARSLAVDPMYTQAAHDIGARAARDTADTWARYAAHVDVTQDYMDLQGHRWAGAAAAFVADMQAHPERYVAGALPDLPFPDGKFDLVTCMYFVFTYNLVKPEDAIRELARVTKPGGRILIHPLYSTTGERQPAEDILQRLLDDGTLSQGRVFTSSYDAVPGVPAETLSMTRAPAAAA